MEWFWFILGIISLALNDSAKAAKEGKVLWFIWEFFGFLLALFVMANNIPWA